MAISLAKGAKINLSKEFGVGKDGLTNLLFGLGWDTQKYDGQEDFDLDANTFMLDENGKSPVDGSGFVFYGDGFRISKDGSVKYSGDNRTGKGEGDDESVTVDLKKVSDKFNKISFAATINKAKERKQNFGQVSNAYVRIVNADTNEELLKYELDEEFSTETGIVVGELYKKNDEWRFAAVGSGFEGGLYSIAKGYGLDVTED